MGREKVNFNILNTPVQGIEDWEGITLKASFDGLSEDASITTSEFNLVRDARDVVWKDVLNGNIFKGREIEINISDRFKNSITAFEGFIDENLEFINPNEKGVPTKILARIIKNNSVETLRTSLNGTTYGFLESKGFINPSLGQTVFFVTEDPNTGEKLLILSITSTLLAIQIAQTTKDTITDINIAIGIASGSITGTVGAAIFSGLSALASAAFTAVLLIQISTLAKEMFRLVLPKLRKQKALSIRQTLDVALSYFGYTLDTNITDMDLFHIIPSNNDGEKDVNIGTLKTGDFGYNAGEFFSFVLSLFNAKAAIKDKILTIRNREDDYWKNNSSVVLNDVKIDSFRYNTDELIANRVYAFDYDINNEYSITDRKDAIYQVVTSQNPEMVSKNSDLIKGLEEVNWNYSLCSRKTGLSTVENGLLKLGATFDSAINFFGGNSNYKSQVKRRDGAVRVSQTTTNVPSIAPIVSSKLPVNHKDLLNAETIEKKYHYGKSFVRNNSIGQKKIVTLVNVPFTLNDFVKTINTGLVRTSQGKYVEIDETGEGLEWEIASQTATITYREPFKYTSKLKEIEIRNG